MKVKVMGTSCTWFKRENTSYVIDDEIIFDVPNGTYKNLIKVMDLEKTKCVLISHLHTDHFFDLRIIVTRFLRDFKDRPEKLRIYAPKGTAETLIEINRLVYGGFDECSEEYVKSKIEFFELSDGFEFEEGSYNIRAYKMNHSILECFGFTFTDKKTGTVVGFSSDTAMCDNLHKMLSVSSYAFVEMASMEKCKTHLCCEEFEFLMAKYDKCKMFPVHTSDVCQEYAENNGLNYLVDGQTLNF